MAELFRAMRLIEIDAAHRVQQHGSKCCALHGHRYRVELHVQGELQVGGTQDGMTVDFGFLKDGLMQYVDGPCDHGLIVEQSDPLLDVLIEPTIVGNARKEVELFGFYADSRFSNGRRTAVIKFYVLPYAPTAENLARHFYERLRAYVKDVSSERCWIEKVVVHETPNCTATFPGS